MPPWENRLQSFTLIVSLARGKYSIHRCPLKLHREKKIPNEGMNGAVESVKVIGLNRVSGKNIESVWPEEARAICRGREEGLFVRCPDYTRRYKRLAFTVGPLPAKSFNAPHTSPRRTIESTAFIMPRPGMRNSEPRKAPAINKKISKTMGSSSFWKVANDEQCH
jgi:hypothetical protein